MVDGISTLLHLLYGCSKSESCLSRQIKKRVRVDPGGRVGGLIRALVPKNWNRMQRVSGFGTLIEGSGP